MMISDSAYSGFEDLTLELVVPPASWSVHCGLFVVVSCTIFELVVWTLHTGGILSGVVAKVLDSSTPSVIDVLRHR